MPATHISPTNEGTKPFLVRGGARRVEMSEAPPAADEASEFRGSAPLVATNGKQEAAGATVYAYEGSQCDMWTNSVPKEERRLWFHEIFRLKRNS